MCVVSLGAPVPVSVDPCVFCTELTVFAEPVTDGRGTQLWRSRRLWQLQLNVSGYAGAGQIEETLHEDWDRMMLRQRKSSAAARHPSRRRLLGGRDVLEVRTIAPPRSKSGWPTCWAQLRGTHQQELNMRTTSEEAFLSRALSVRGAHSLRKQAAGITHTINWRPAPRNAAAELFARSGKVLNHVGAVHGMRGFLLVGVCLHVVFDWLLHCVCAILHPVCAITVCIWSAMRESAESEPRTKKLRPGVDSSKRFRCLRMKSGIATEARRCGTQRCRGSHALCRRLLRPTKHGLRNNRFLFLILFTLFILVAANIGKTVQQVSWQLGRTGDRVGEATRPGPAGFPTKHLQCPKCLNFFSANKTLKSHLERRI